MSTELEASLRSGAELLTDGYDNGVLVVRGVITSTNGDTARAAKILPVAIKQCRRRLRSGELPPDRQLWERGYLIALEHGLASLAATSGTVTRNQ